MEPGGKFEVFTLKIHLHQRRFDAKTRICATPGATYGLCQFRQGLISPTYSAPKQSSFVQIFFLRHLMATACGKMCQKMKLGAKALA